MQAWCLAAHSCPGFVGRAAASTVVIAMESHVGLVGVVFLYKSFPVFGLGLLAIHTEFCFMADFYLNIKSRHE